MVPAPWDADAYRRKGEIVGYNDERFRTVYEPGVDILQVFDAERRAAVYWSPSFRFVPWWESSFPMRTGSTGGRPRPRRSSRCTPEPSGATMEEC